MTTRALLAWMLGTAVPVLGLALISIEALAEGGISARELALTALALGAVALAAGLIVAWQSARSISDPLRSLRGAVRRVERGDLEAEVPVFDGSELGLLQAGFNRMGAGLRGREVIRDLFGRHVGEEVVRAAMERGIELGGGSARSPSCSWTSSVPTRLAAERPAPEQPGRVLALAAAIERAGGEEAGHWSLGGAVRLRGREADTRVAEPADASVPSG